MTTDRDALLGAAQRLLNVDPGAPMAAIASAANVSRATMHRYFDSRDALLVELGTRSLDRWERRLDDVGVEQVAATGDPAAIRAALETLVLGYVEDSEDFGFALTDPVILANDALDRRAEELADREATLFTAAQAAGVLRRDLPPRWFGYAIYGLLVASRDALRLGVIARRDAGSSVLSSLLEGISE